MPVKISAMDPYAGDLTGVYLPVIVPVEEDNPWVNYRMLASDVINAGANRFGVLTEDDTAAEDRAFTMPDTYSFAIYNGDNTFNTPVRYMFITSIATSMGTVIDPLNRTDVNVYADFAEMAVQVAGVTVSQVKVDDTGILISNTSGNVQIPNLLEVPTANILYYDTVNGDITYGPVTDFIDSSSLRFGFSGEDDTAAENRSFNVGSNNFSLPGLLTATTSDIIYYDTVTGDLTYGAAPSGGSTRFGVSGEDDLATEIRIFDFDTTFRMVWSGSIVDDPLFNIHNDNVAGISTVKVDSVGSTKSLVVTSENGRGIQVDTSGTGTGLYVQNSGTGQAATFTSLGNANYTVDINAAVGTQSGGLAIICEGVSVSALNVSCTSGLGALVGVSHDSDDTTILPILKLRRQVVSVSPAVGMGASLVFELNVDDGASDNTLVNSNQITSEWTDPNDSTQTSKLTILGVSVGVDTQLMIMEGDGRISTPNLPTYADDAAAGSGGLTTGYWYQTAAGALRIKL